MLESLHLVNNHETLLGIFTHHSGTYQWISEYKVYIQDEVALYDLIWSTEQSFLWIGNYPLCNTVFIWECATNNWICVNELKNYQRWYLAALSVEWFLMFWISCIQLRSAVFLLRCQGVGVNKVLEKFRVIIKEDD